MRWSGVSKSSTREVGDDARISWKRVAASPSCGGAVVADAAARRRPSGTNTRVRVVRDPVARRVVDRVAGRAAHAEQLRLRLLAVADEREVLVAVLVDLAARPSSRGGGPTTRRRTSCGTGSTPRRPSRASSTPTGHDVLDEQRLAVGHHEVGLERRLGEPAADHREGADRVGQDLAVAAEALGDRDRAHLGAGRRPSRRSSQRRPPAWYSASVDSRGTWRSERRPRLGALRACAAYSRLERLVARVVGHALGEVRAVRRLDHAVGHQPVDAQRLRRARPRAKSSVSTICSTRHEPPRRGHAA